MISASRYRNFCRIYLGKVINHDDSIPDSKLKEYAKQTNTAYANANILYGIDDVDTEQGLHLANKNKRAVDVNVFGSYTDDFGKEYVHGSYKLPEDTAPLSGKNSLLSKISVVIATFKNPYRR